MEDGGPSQTARHVAAHRLDFTRVPADYGDPAADQALAVDVAAGRQAPANRMHDYLAARTAFFDRAVTGALGRGVAQVVVGAAGYDGRAFRYAKPGVRWFEVDHPATQRDKLRRLGRLGIDASHVRFVEADFTRDPVAARLRAAGLDPEAPSLFLASAGPATPAGPQRRPRQPAQGHDGDLPLSALLSQALVAFTIEFDNEAEHRLPHRTTSHGTSGPGDGAPKLWLVSLAMWENCMRYVTGEPITVGDLEARARTGTNLDGMRRWGYITIDGTAGKVHSSRPGSAAVLRATAAGLRAREIWRPLPALIERRWRERFGTDQLSRLRDPLTSMVSRLDPGLPDCLPILGAALLSQGPDPRLPSRPDGAAPEAMPLSALLSRVLLSFAVEYERQAGLSLAVAANVLRVLGTGGIRLRDLPALTGTSKESVRWALGILIWGDLAAEDPDPAASRGKVARLTPRGLDAQRLYHELTGEIERRWHDRFTPAVTAALLASLEPLAAGQPPPLFGGLEPYPDNWRALVRRPDVLPHFPMVLHRGGYPDGS
jgi:hypothetical protein